MILLSANGGFLWSGIIANRYALGEKSPTEYRQEHHSIHNHQPMSDETRITRNSLNKPNK